MENSYYSDKLDSLRDIFGTPDVRLEEGRLKVGAKAYPIVNDVIVLLEPEYYPPHVRKALEVRGTGLPPAGAPRFSEDVQFTFSEQWKAFSKVLPEYQRELEEYFDIMDISELQGMRVCDLGCGQGRWSYLLRDKCRELVLLDFSEAVFVARENLRGVNHALFFNGDLTRLPFRENFADFLFCLGVLHHVPVDALQLVRGLKKCAPKLLIYLYYALDNRPAYFKLILAVVTAMRLMLCKIRNKTFRNAFTWFGVFALYLPPIGLGRLLKPFGLSKYVPLSDEHYWNSIEELRHHVYDRFFTSIEQRVSREQIRQLKDTFPNVVISDNPGYWHFLCVSESGG